MAAARVTAVPRAPLAADPDARRAPALLPRGATERSDRDGGPNAGADTRVRDAGARRRSSCAISFARSSTMRFP
ncbi:MAG TPA: hypothetical protein VFO79_16405, partial [Xanthomonadales bacterium]|nr:hypothetical protein [Xanthomonadales bacterium]